MGADLRRLDAARAFFHEPDPARLHVRPRAHTLGAVADHRRERFQKALWRARALIGAGAGDFQKRLSALLGGRTAPPYPERFVIKALGRVFFLRAEEVDWVEAAANYVRLHAGREAHLLRETMNTMATRLDPAKFLRIRRSAIVNIERIKELQPWFRGEYVVVLRDGTHLTSSRGYRDPLERLLK